MMVYEASLLTDIFMPCQHLLWCLDVDESKLAIRIEICRACVQVYELEKTILTYIPVTKGYY